MHTIKKLEMIKKKEDLFRTIKNIIFIINSHDMQRCLITHEEHYSDITQTKREIKKLCRNITRKEIYNSNKLQFLIEIMRDLNTSVMLSEYAHYKMANSTLRNVLEHFLRFLYFHEHPKKRDSFIFGINKNRYNSWYAISNKNIDNVTLWNNKLKNKFKLLYKDLSKFTHSYYNSSSRNLVEISHYDVCLFLEWKSYFMRTINLVTKILNKYFN